MWLRKSVDLESVITELGSFGKYQLRVFGYLMICVISKALYNAQYVFTAGPIEYRCMVPECESVPQKFDTKPWGAFALPPDRSCKRRVPIGTTCEPSSFSNATMQCNAWVYKEDYTIVYDFNLACEEWKRTLVGTVHSFAYFTGIPVTALISDIYGRRVALIITSVAPSFVGVARAFCNDYYLYLVLEYLESFVGCGTYSTAFILGLELVNIGKRVVGGNTLSITYAVGHTLLGLIAMLFPYWRHLTLVIYAPAVLFIFYIFIAEESIRWLVAKGRQEEAAAIILRAAKINNKSLSLQAIAMLKTPSSTPIQGRISKTFADILRLTPPPPKKPPSMFRRVLNSRVMLFRMTVCSFWWVTMTLVYYGLSINSVSLAGNRYINFILTAVIEIPGYMLSMFTLDRFGRKSSMIVAFLVCGTALIAIAFVSNLAVIIGLTLTGKLCISMIFSSIYIYTIELFPTEARHILTGVCSSVGRIGSMLAPQTPLLMAYMEALPYILFGLMSTIAGMLMLLTPETLRIKLPNTIEEAESEIRPRTRKKTDMLSTVFQEH